MKNNFRQTGDFLIEALIGMVLMAVIGMGIVHVSSKSAVAQRNMNLQDIAVNSLRAALIQNQLGAIDICTTAPTVTFPIASNGNVTTTLTADIQGCTNRTTTASIGGVDVANVPKPIVLSVTNDFLGGQVVVGGTWQ